LQTWGSPFKDTPIIPIIQASVNIIYHILWHHIFNSFLDFQKTTPIFIRTYKIPTLLCCRRKAKVNLVVALLKRWLLGTYQGGVQLSHLDYYLDEFTFRFNRRTSRSRGKLFYRLIEQAAAIDPLPGREIRKGFASP
jgi:hypothetical protein